MWQIAATGSPIQSRGFKEFHEKTNAKQAEKDHGSADMTFVFSEELHFNSRLERSGSENSSNESSIV